MRDYNSQPISKHAQELILHKIWDRRHIAEAARKRKNPLKMSGLSKINPATSYFPTPERCSIIGSSKLNFRVRDGNGCDLTDNITGKLFARVTPSGVIAAEATTHAKFSKPDI